MSNAEDFRPGPRTPPAFAPRPFAFRLRSDGTVKCLQCGDTNWVEVGPHTTVTPTVRPCSDCMPETFERWLRDFPPSGSSRRDAGRRQPAGAEPRPPVPAAPEPERWRQEPF